MKALILILVLAAPAMGQTFDWTLANDPGFVCTSCASVSGSGMFTASPTMFASIQGNGYPILSLTGTLNGSAVSLGHGPAGGLGNLYFAPTLPIPWFASWYLTTSAGTFTLSQSDVPQPGTGQLLATPGGGASSPVAFTVTPYVAPTPKAPPTPTYSSNAGPTLAARGIGMGHVVFQRPAATAIAPRRTPIAIEVSVPAAIGVVVGVVEWQRHRRAARGRFDAVPAGRY